MKFGLLYVNSGPYAEVANAVELAVGAEEAGFESLWAIEHVAVPKDYETQYPYSESGKMPMGSDADLPDPLIWLSMVGAATSRIRLCTGILILPQRNPVVLAKTVATMDAMTGGRVTLGVGAGWLREEFEALGVPFEQRGKRLDEYIAVMRTLWTGEPAAHHGELFDFEDLICRPRPAQQSIPIVIGGHSQAAARRAGRLGDGFFPGGGKLSELLNIVRQTAREHGRSEDSVEVTTGLPLKHAGDIERIERLAARGASRVLIPVPTQDPGEVRKELQRYGEHVITQLS